MEVKYRQSQRRNKKPKKNYFLIQKNRSKMKPEISLVYLGLMVRQKQQKTIMLYAAVIFNYVHGQSPKEIFN